MIYHKIYFEECQWGPKLVTNILQNILFCVSQKKESHTALEPHCYVEFPFNDTELDEKNRET